MTIYWKVLTLGERACVKVKDVNTQEQYLVDGEEVGFVANTNIELATKIRDYIDDLKKKSSGDIAILIRSEPQETPHTSGFYVWSAVFNIKTLNKDEQLAQPQAFGLSYYWPEMINYFDENGNLSLRTAKIYEDN